MCTISLDDVDNRLDGLFEAVLIEIKFANYFRTATLQLDRVVDSGRPIEGTQERVVEVAVTGLKDFQFFKQAWVADVGT